MQKLYKLEDVEVEGNHFDVFGPVYRKSVEEAMSITGVIRPEMKESLNKLKERLGIPEEQAKGQFLDALKQRMIPMVEWIVAETERANLSQQELAQRRKKDLGEDYFQTGKKADGTLGIGAEINVLGDIMNLVDFYTENEIMEKKQIDVKKIEKKIKEGDEEKTVEEEVPVYETLYPITALEAGAITPELAEFVYRQFVVGSFTTQGPNALRYEQSRATFGGILGLATSKMEEIGSNIAETIYDNYISTNMRQKGTLDQQDMMMLANLQGKLGLSAEEGEDLLITTQKKYLSEEAAALASSTNPKYLKAFREKCNTIGIEINDAIGVSAERRKLMFELEIGPGLESGEITTESGELLTEVQESLGFSPEDAEEIFGQMVLKKAEKLFDQVVGSSKRGRTTSMVEPLQQLVRLGYFLNGELDLEVDEAEANKIFNVYEATDFGDLDKEGVEANKEMLRTLLSLS